MRTALNQPAREQINAQLALRTRSYRFLYKKRQNRWLAPLPRSCSLSCGEPLTEQCMKNFLTSEIYVFMSHRINLHPLNSSFSCATKFCGCCCAIGRQSLVSEHSYTAPKFMITTDDKCGTAGHNSLLCLLVGWRNQPVDCRENQLQQDPRVRSLDQRKIYLTTGPMMKLTTLDCSRKSEDSDQIWIA